MTDQTPNVHLSRAVRRKREMNSISEIEADLIAVTDAQKAPRLSNRKRAVLNDDSVFHFNELIAIERHSSSRAARQRCAAIIESRGFDRSTQVCIESGSL
jgi:hypothetical protein